MAGLDLPGLARTPTRAPRKMLGPSLQGFFQILFSLSLVFTDIFLSFFKNNCYIFDSFILCVCVY